MTEPATGTGRVIFTDMRRGLPSDDGDDLLTGDVSALHLSDYDVYAKTSNRPATARKSNDYQRGKKGIRACVSCSQWYINTTSISR